MRLPQFPRASPVALWPAIVRLAGAVLALTGAASLVSAAPLRLVEPTHLAQRASSVGEVLLLDWELLDAEGRPLSDQTVLVRISASWGATLWRGARTDAHGRARVVERLSPGNWSVHARVPGDANRAEASATFERELPSDDVGLQIELPEWIADGRVEARARCVDQPDLCEGHLLEVSCVDSQGAIVEPPPARVRDGLAAATLQLHETASSSGREVFACRAELVWADEERTVRVGHEAAVTWIRGAQLDVAHRTVRGATLGARRVALGVEAADGAGAPLADAIVQWEGAAEPGAPMEVLGRERVDGRGRAELLLDALPADGIALRVSLFAPSGGGPALRVHSAWVVAERDPRALAAGLASATLGALLVAWVLAARRSRRTGEATPPPPTPRSAPSAPDPTAEAIRAGGATCTIRIVDARRGLPLAARLLDPVGNTLVVTAAGVALGPDEAKRTWRVEADGYRSADLVLQGESGDRVVPVDAWRDLVRDPLDQVIAARGERRIPTNWWGRWTLSDVESRLASSLRRLTRGVANGPVPATSLRRAMDALPAQDLTEREALQALCLLVDAATFGPEPADARTVALAHRLAARALGRASGDVGSESLDGSGVRSRARDLDGSGVNSGARDLDGSGANSGAQDLDASGGAADA